MRISFNVNVKAVLTVVAVAGLSVGSFVTGRHYEHVHADKPALELVWDGTGYPATCLDREHDKTIAPDDHGQCVAPSVLFAQVRPTSEKTHAVSHDPGDKAASSEDLKV